MLHGRLRAIALDLEDAELRTVGLAFQVEACAERGQPLPRLVEILVVLLGLDRGEHLVLQHFQLQVLDLVRRLLALALVLHTAGLVLGALLRDLLQEVAVFGGLLERELLLVLPVELHEHVAGATWLPGAASRVITSDSRPPPVWRGNGTEYHRVASVRPVTRSVRTNSRGLRRVAAGSVETGRSGAASPGGASRHTAKTAVASRHAVSNRRCAHPRRRTPGGCLSASLPAEMDMATSVLRSIDGLGMIDGLRRHLVGSRRI